MAGAIGAGLLTVALFAWAGPSWQINDDPYYAMLADGYGMVERPVAAVPYMHPLVGEALALFRSGGLRPSYALFLMGLLAVVAAVLGYGLARARPGPFGWVLAAAAFFPVALSLQYTVVCALLVAAASVLLARPDFRPPSIGVGVACAVLLWLASLLRLQMVVMAVLCMFPPLLVGARQQGVALKPWLSGLAMIGAAVAAGHLVADLATANHRLDAFYRLNNPMAVLMNYGYIEALEVFQSSLPEPYTPSDIGLMARWFFADLNLMEPGQVSRLTESVPFLNVLKVRYWMFLDSSRAALSTHWLWLLAGAFVLSLAGRTRTRAALAPGIVTFVCLLLVSAVLLKPVPERVAAGMALGLFLLALLLASPSWQRPAERGTLAISLLILPILASLSWLTFADRQRLDEAWRAWERDKPALAGVKKAYFFAGSLPLRAAFGPMVHGRDLPVLIPLGSMYFTPEVLDAERASPCGGFLGCLLSGEKVTLIAGTKEMERLKAWLAARYGRELVVETAMTTSSFQVQTVSTIPQGGGNAPVTKMTGA